MSNKTIILILLLIFSASFIFANGQQDSNDEKTVSLGITEQQFAIDGVVNASEYSAKFEYKGVVFFLGRDKDTIRFGIQSEAKGWVSCGFNSTMMNDALIYMAYVMDNKVFATEQIGMQHKHQDIDEKRLIKWAAKESSEGTTFEGQIKTADLIKPDQTELGVILAFSNDDSFKGRHRFRTGFIVPLKK